jgi:hypothetical protein
MFLAELAVLFHFDPVGIVLLVFLGVVIPLFTLCACHDYFNSHKKTPPAPVRRSRALTYLYICRLSGTDILHKKKTSETEQYLI